MLLGRDGRWVGAVSLMVLALLAATALAAGKRSKLAKIGEYIPNAETVEMFSAMEKGDIAVKLIPKDSTESNVVIENKSDRPLNIKLPSAFAGVPALAQAAAGGRGRSGSSGGNRSGNQGTGGGMSGMGGMGGGMFSLPPEAVGKFRVETVCLDHGKAEPRAAVPYEIKPIESYTTKPGVREVCQMLGEGKLNQRAAQAATWHLNNGMSWEQLAAKRLRHANGTSEPYFSSREIQAGMQIAATASALAKQQESTSPKRSRSRATPVPSGS